MNGARSSCWFIELQRIGARMCKITSNVLHKVQFVYELRPQRLLVY